MDPVTHTLTGVALGRAGLGNATPLAMAALFIGANVPDIDILAAFGGADASLGFRRGWTHGPVGLLTLPLALVALLWLWRRFTAKPEAPPVHYGRLTLIAYLAALTHPVLDWLNTYGIRFIFPFSETWFYGDAVFIIDPWLWLMLACPVMLASSATWAGKGMWLLGGGVVSAVIVSASLVPQPALGAWLAGVAFLLVLRMRWSPARDVSVVARAAVMLAVLYMGMNVAGSSLARRQAVSLSAVPIGDVLMTGPVPGNPFWRKIVSEGSDRSRGSEGGGVEWYDVQTINWLTGQVVTGVERFAVNDGVEARAAMAAPEISGYANWVRFPTYRVAKTDSGYRVDIVDVRYASLTDGGFGTATVFLDDDFEPAAAEVN